MAKNPCHECWWHYTPGIIGPLKCHSSLVVKTGMLSPMLREHQIEQIMQFDVKDIVYYIDRTGAPGPISSLESVIVLCR